MAQISLSDGEPRNTLQRGFRDIEDQSFESAFQGLFSEMSEIASNDFNLNISRYVSTAQADAEIDLAAKHVRIEDEIRTAMAKHNEFLRELGLPPLP